VPASLDLSVIVPAHNEGPNLRVLLPQLRTILDGLGIESDVMVVVRDVEAQTREAVGPGLGTIVQQREPGYGGALRTGFSLAAGRYVLTMDADLSHPPTFVADLWSRRDEAEVLIASRYVEGGGARMPLVRALLSRVLNRFFALGLGVPLRDLSSGFRLYRASALDLRAVTARDFDVLPEIVVRAYTEGWRVAEIPFRYEPRAHGSSNARIIPFGLAYARTFRALWSLRNSVASADYEDRAFDSVVPLQRVWQRRRYRHVTGLLEGGRTLDVGCGSSRILAGLPRGSVGVDLSIRKLRHARRFDRLLVQASALRLPFRDGAFACVLSSNLLELLPRDGLALDELVRVLAPGGRLILATPDYGRWLWILVGALYERLVPGAGASRHLARYTRRELVAELAGRGCALETTRSILAAEVILAFRKAERSSPAPSTPAPAP
jgi:dolichol-phosphate mannosyltransferase